MRRLMLVVVAATACSGDSGITDPRTHPDTAAPGVVRELRGLWVATVANIDWPSATTLSSAQQRTELLEILDRAASIGMNAIVLQVRPAADAVYASSLEPWAAVLTGTQGRDPGYDPLAFAVEEAHARGLELHAWINPFRAGNTSDTLRLAANHIFRTRRDLVRVYGGNIWLDPGDPDVHEHSLRVIADIVRRYDIDAIHADDYFYPYVVNDAANRPIPFPDSATYARHGGALSRDDWRRANVDRFVERLYREVHGLKPTLRVGISPFGIWRPNNPPGVQGLDAYASIYADSRRWLQEGWVDYLAPQLYWAIAAPQQSFPALLDWWMSQSTRGRHVWPGLAAYRVLNGTSSAFSLQEIPTQVRLTRQRPAGSGHLLYNTTWTLKRHGGATADSLRGLYTAHALAPAFPWLDALTPARPALQVRGDTVLVEPASSDVRWWLIRRKGASGWNVTTRFHTIRRLSDIAGLERVLVEAVDQAGNVSPPAEWRRP